MTKSVSKANRPARSTASATPKGGKKPSSKPRKRLVNATSDEGQVSSAGRSGQTKQNQLAALLLRDEGATLDQMIALTGWLPHTTRAAMSGLRKKGYVIDSDKLQGIRTYRAVAPE